MNFYQSLGLQPVINAATTFTALGGSLMPPEVVDAMNSAAGAFVDMHELHQAAGNRLAALTSNEAAYVTPGCAAGLVLAILGIRTGGNPAAIMDFPGHDDTPHEVIMHAAHRIPYDAAIALAGAKIRQIGNVQQTFGWELEGAITKDTAAVLYVPGSHLPQVALPLEQVIDIAHGKGVPVIVDAAAQLPPMENLWHFSRDLGADLVLFSGGKALRGPQGSGLMVGRPDLIEAARQNGAPFQRWARPMKVSKEDIAGLVAAVTRFMSLDHAALHSAWLQTVDEWRESISEFSGVEARTQLRNEAGQPVPRLHVVIDDPDRARRALDRLGQSNPRVAVLADVRNGVPYGFWLSPDLLADGQAEIVRNVVVDALQEMEANDR